MLSRGKNQAVVLLIAVCLASFVLTSRFAASDLAASRLAIYGIVMPEMKVNQTLISWNLILISLMVLVLFNN
jgi:hypothetical protein